eukprot:Colp12_sorted_trinity150504_noHs@8405
MGCGYSLRPVEVSPYPEQDFPLYFETKRISKSEGNHEEQTEHNEMRARLVPTECRLPPRLLRDLNSNQKDRLWAIPNRTRHVAVSLTSHVILSPRHYLPTHMQSHCNDCKESLGPVAFTQENLPSLDDIIMPPRTKEPVTLTRPLPVDLPRVDLREENERKVERVKRSAFKAGCEHNPNSNIEQTLVKVTEAKAEKGGEVVYVCC